MKRKRKTRQALEVCELAHFGFGEFDIGGGEIFLDVLQVEGHGNGDDARLHDQPGEGDLEDGGVVRLGDLFERFVRWEFALVKRGVGGEQDVVLLTVFQHAAFHVGAIGEAVGDLVGDDGRLGKFLRLFELTQVEVAHAQVFDHALAREFVHGAESLFQVHAGSRPVDQVEVEVVRAEVAEAVFAGLEEQVVGQVPRMDFGGDENLLAFGVGLS